MIFIFDVQFVVQLLWLQNFGQLSKINCFKFVKAYKNRTSGDLEKNYVGLQSVCAFAISHLITWNMCTSVTGMGC